MTTGVAKAIPECWVSPIGDYLLAQAAAGRPPTTLSTRRSHLSHMARALRCQPEDVTAEQLVRWFGRQSQWKPETRRGYRNTLRSFYLWAFHTGRLSTDLSGALPKVKATKPSPRPAPDLVWHTALVAADRRVTLMLRLAAEAGLRRAEVAQVRTDDLTEGIGGPLLLVRGKGNKKRIIPITDDLAAEIAEGPRGHTLYAPADGWLFPGDENGHLSPRWVGKLCSTALPGIWTMHTLRHRFSANVYRGSRNLRALQTLLGHESVATTEIYTPVDDDEVRAAMEFAAAKTSRGVA